MILFIRFIIQKLIEKKNPVYSDHLSSIYFKRSKFLDETRNQKLNYTCIYSNSSFSYNQSRDTLRVYMRKEKRKQAVVINLDSNWWMNA
jgi:hypothetical protein